MEPLDITEWYNFDNIPVVTKLEMLQIFVPCRNSFLLLKTSGDYYQKLLHRCRDFPSVFVELHMHTLIEQHASIDQIKSFLSTQNSNKFQKQ